MSLRPSSSSRASYARLASTLQYLVDPRVGVVGAIDEVRREAGGPDFFHFAARAANTSAFSRLENFANSGGAGITRADAVAKSVGEAVERYCSAIFDYEDLPLASYRSASFPCARPASFVLYSPDQYAAQGFPWVPFEDDTVIRWTPALDLSSGTTCFVPAARCFIPYVYYLQAGDSPIDQPISTGLACHVSWTQAALSGICEVIERDAFLITWQAMLPPPQIRLASLSATNRDLVARFEQVGSTVVLFNITLDHGVPSILAVLRGGTPVEPALVFAASASPDPEEATRKSLEELAHTRRYCRIIKDHVPRIVPAPPLHENVQVQMDHLNFWSDENNASLAEWIFQSPRRVDFGDIENLATGDPQGDLRAVVDRLVHARAHVLVADITTPDIADLGLCVVRAVIPELHPLHLGYTSRALGGSRLWEVPQRLGYRGIDPSTGDNPSPHPYP